MRLKAIFLLALWSLAWPASIGCAAPHSLARIGWTVQVGAFSEVRNAENLARLLQGKGVEAFYFRNERGFFAVRFGDYGSREEAAARARELSEEGTIGSYYLAPPRGAPDKGGKAPDGSAGKERDDEDMGWLAARTAERFVGIPYRWGGDNVAEGLDCSGFVRAVYNLCGVSVPRTAAAQYKVGRRIDSGQLRDGDLVFFGTTSRISHVGIYSGGGKMVHAPRRGEDIKVSSLADPSLARKFMGARRYF